MPPLAVVRMKFFFLRTASYSVTWLVQDPYRDDVPLFIGKKREKNAENSLSGRIIGNIKPRGLNQLP